LTGLHQSRKERKAWNGKADQQMAGFEQAVSRDVLRAIMLIAPAVVLAQQASYDGLTNNLSNIYRTSNSKSFSVSPENPTGEKGKGGMAVEGTASAASRDLGQGWKVNPFVVIEPGQTFTLANIAGPGAIQHIWMTPTGNWRTEILRMYWDDETQPSVETPAGDFFGMGWGKYAPIRSLAVCVNPGSALNSYWPMPFRKRARITMEIWAASASRSTIRSTIRARTCRKMPVTCTLNFAG
jgi:hypothetical protein